MHLNNFSDSDSDTSSGKVQKAPKLSTSSALTGSSGKAKYKSGPQPGSATGLDMASSKHSNQSSPSNSRVAVREIKRPCSVSLRLVY